MVNHHVTLSDEKEEHDAVEQKGHYWWRSAAKFQESAKLKLFMIPNLSNISPKFNLLREMERLALSSPDGLDDLRHKLFRYRSGDLWVPTGCIRKEDMDIPPVITILLVGFHSAGKSSLVNLMYSVLGRSGLVPFAQTSSAGSVPNHTTMFMGEHNVLRSPRSGFCVYDTRGFDYDRMDEAAQQLSEWMVDGVHHNQICSRHGDSLLSEDETSYLKSSFKYATRKVNCVMVVANVAEIHKSLNAGDMEPLVSLRQLYYSPVLRKCNENPILILTHGDKLPTEDRIDARIKICEYFGVSEITGVYDIFCLSEYGFAADDVDPVTAYAVTEAVYKALLISDRSHLPKTRLTDRMISALSWFLWSIASFFALIARFFYKLGLMGKMRF